VHSRFRALRPILLSMRELSAGAPAPLRLFVGATVIVFGAAAAISALAHSLEPWVATSISGGSGGATLLVLAIACGLFVAAGSLRLVVWRLDGDPRGALLGVALIAMGSLCLPTGGIASLVIGAENAWLVGATTRCVTSFVVMTLLLRAFRVPNAHPVRPVRALMATACIAGLVFVVMLAVPPRGQYLTVQALTMSVVMAAGWIVVAARASGAADTWPWARRATPLLLAMAMIELLRGLDLGGWQAWTLAGVLLAAVVGAMATRSALIDIDAAVTADERELTGLTSAVLDLSDETQQLAAWREELAHDTRNACAGLRAAMEILDRYDGQVDPAIVDRLRVAALQEVGHIEHLVTRSTEQPCEWFDVREVVTSMCGAARSLGASVSVHARPAHAFGRPADLAAALKNLLVNAQTHAPGSHVDVVVSSDADTVTIRCSDDGPGLGGADRTRLFDRGYRASSKPGSGLGLHAARKLMHDQDGDLRVGASGHGATFVMTLKAASPVPGAVGSARPAPAARIRVPSQRPGSTRTAVGPHTTLAVAR